MAGYFCGASASSRCVRQAGCDRVSPDHEAGAGFSRNRLRKAGKASGAVHLQCRASNTYRYHGNRNRPW
jgi:hypothetical protein